jgi:hypothetical protein
MPESTARTGRACPSGWWYGLAAAIATATVVVTGIVGYGRAVDLIDRVEGFHHFGGSGTSVSIVEPGDYAVYQEWVERGGGNPYATGTPATEPVVTVTGPDGTDVPVRPSSVSYGWGRQQAEAVGTFEATQPGAYRIDATGTEGRLAFGEIVPGSPLYGFGGPLVAAGAVVIACLVGALVVAKRRRDWRSAPVATEPNGADGRPGPTRAVTPVAMVAGVAVVAVAVIGGVVILAGRDGSEPPDAVLTEGPSGDGAQAPWPSVDCTSDEDVESGMCGLDPEELRETNLAYADRMVFTGDLAAATAIADQARTALGPLADVQPPPTPDQVADALAAFDHHVVVSDNAVRTGGAAFAIDVGGGCVFGSVYDGAVDVEIGGYVNDGGCLAVYGH